MGINRDNINKLSSRRLAKRLLILFVAVAIPISTVLGIYYSLGGEKTSKDYKISESTYEAVFVERAPIDKKIFIGEASKSIQEIYKAYDDEKNELKLPVYHDHPAIRFKSQNKETVFQLDDIDFSKGKDEFSKWGSHIIFIFNSNHQIKEIQFKNAK